VNVGGYAGPFPWVTVNAVRCRLHLRAGEWVNHGDKVRIYISPKEVRDSAGRYLGRWS
jgi:hypothetical protein